MDHTLVHQFLERLFLAAYAEVEEELIPETTVDQVTRGMLRTSYIEIHILPVVISFLRNQCLFIVGIHIAQIVSRRTGKARHREEFQWEDGLVVDCSTINN